MKCNRDCFNCPFPDCIEDEMTAADYDEARERDREIIFPKSRKEEGRLLGLPENRFGICGTFFVAGDDGGEDFVSLSREQVEFLTRSPSQPSAAGGGESEAGE